MLSRSHVIECLDNILGDRWTSASHRVGWNIGDQLAILIDRDYQKLYIIFTTSTRSNRHWIRAEGYQTLFAESFPLLAGTVPFALWFDSDACDDSTIEEWIGLILYTNGVS